MTHEPSIVIEGLSKRYHGNVHLSLDNLNLQVNPGEVYGFLGPNGAGKSTTIRLLMNYLQPTSGSATILGKDIVSGSVEIKKDIGYLSGDFDVYPKMTGKQYIEYLCQLQGGRGKTYSKELLNRLQAVTNKRLGELSRGQRQKIGIVQALMHQPKVLILDEPTSGLDPLMQEVFYEFIDEAKHRGTAVFVSSHILSEVQKMCDKVGIIREGKLITERNINEMANEAAQTFDITFTQAAPITAIKKVPGLKLVQHHDNRVSVHMHGDLKPLFKVLSAYDVTTIDARNLDLEEMFMHYYQNGAKK